MLTTLAVAVLASGELAATPYMLKARGTPIDVGIGHAAPAYADIDGDGLKELLVGQFEGGKCRVYPNKGTNEDPKFEDFTWLQADGKDATVEYG